MLADRIGPSGNPPTTRVLPFSLARETLFRGRPVNSRGVFLTGFEGFEIIDEPGQGDLVHFPDIPDGDTEPEGLILRGSDVNDFPSETDLIVP